MTAGNVHKHVEAVGRELARWHTAVMPGGGPSESTPGGVLLARKWLGILGAPGVSVWKKSSYNCDVLKLELESFNKRVIDSPLRMCHNDLLPLNLLLNKKEGSVKFIDYEYACYNSRGFDVGNYFCEFAGFDLDYSRYPPRKTQIKFIEAYLGSIYGHSGPFDAEEVDHIWREANEWSLFSHFLWGIWGLMQAKNSSIDFDFIGYSNKRLNVYFYNRDKFFTSTNYEYVEPDIWASAKKDEQKEKKKKGKKNKDEKKKKQKGEDGKKEKKKKKKNTAEDKPKVVVPKNDSKW